MKAAGVIFGKNPVLAAIFILICLGGFLRWQSLRESIARSPDEYIYSYQARTVAISGLAGIKSLVKEYNSNQELWIYPPPTRIGYYGILAGVMKLSGVSHVKQGAYLSVFFSIFSLLVLSLIGIRFFNPWVTLYGLLFLSVSFADIAVSIRTWQDAFLAFLGGGLIYFSCSIIDSPERKNNYFFLAGIGTYCLLIKESGVVIYGLCVAWILWVLFREKKLFPRGMFLSAAYLLSILVAFLFMAALTGGIGVLTGILKHVKDAMPTNNYGVVYQSGPVRYFLQEFILVSPLSAFFFVFSLLAVSLPARLTGRFRAGPTAFESRIVGGMIFFVIAFFLIAAIVPYSQNLRYISAVFLPFYLVSGFGFWKMVLLLRSFFDKRFHAAIILVLFLTVVGIGAVSDFMNFRKLFLMTDCLDLSVKMVRECLR